MHNQTIFREIYEMGAFEAIKGHASWSAFNLFKEHVSRIANILHKVKYLLNKKITLTGILESVWEHLEKEINRHKGMKIAGKEFSKFMYEETKRFFAPCICLIHFLNKNIYI